MFDEASEGAGWLVSERLTEAASEIVSRQDQFALADGGDHTKANRESEKIAASKFDAFSGKQSYESRVHESPRSDGSAEQSKQEALLHKLQQSGDESKIAAAEAIIASHSV